MKTVETRATTISLQKLHQAKAKEEKRWAGAVEGVAGRWSRRTGGEMLMIMTVSEEPMLVKPRDEDGDDAGWQWREEMEILRWWWWRSRDKRRWWGCSLREKKRQGKSRRREGSGSQHKKISALIKPKIEIKTLLKKIYNHTYSFDNSPLKTKIVASIIQV